MEKSFVFKFMGLNFELSGIIGSTLMALAVLFICIWLSRKVEMKPNKRQNVFEYLLDFTNGIVIICFRFIPFHLVYEPIGNVPRSQS